MEVDGASFSHHLLGLLTNISEADFVSFDLELSGIPSRLPNRKPRGQLTLEDRYAETKQGADRYQILQVGLTCARFDYVASRYTLQPYNINLSPLLDERLDLEREISLQSGACTFLLNCGFDLGAPFARGVQYLSREEAERAKRLAHDRIDKKNPVSDLQLKDTDVESLDFVRRCRKAITAWQQSASSSLDITSSTGLASSVQSVSRFEKRLVHQLVRAEFPGAVAIGRSDCIRILPFDPVREADNTRRLKTRVKEQIERQTGFRWIFEALVGGEINPDLLYHARGSTGVDSRDRFHRAAARLAKKQPVLVGHNMFTDIVYLYRTFVGPLPDTLADFCRELHKLFPRIVDTKYLATHAEGDLNASPTLEEIARGLQDQPLPSIAMHEDHGKYNNVEAFHEAGYDSLLTATIMLRLAAKLGAEQKGEAKPATAPVPTPALQREASGGGIRLTAGTTEDFVAEEREKASRPVAVPPLEPETTSSGDRKRNKKGKRRRAKNPSPSSTAAAKFATNNLFDSLAALSLDAHDTSDEDGEVAAACSGNTTATATNGSWTDEVYVPDRTGWVPIQKPDRVPMEMIPAFDGDNEGGFENFWARFGNTLRVFGTEEREVRIAAWPGRVES